jgi:hypothetical protein
MRSLWFLTFYDPVIFNSSYDFRGVLMKQDLIETTTQDQGLPTKAAAFIVNTFLNTLIKTLMRGGKIELQVWKMHRVL